MEVKRIHVPLPTPHTRQYLLERLLRNHVHDMLDADYADIVAATDGYSGSDLTALAQDAALGPIRDVMALDTSVLRSIPSNAIRPIAVADFHGALRRIRRSVAPGSEMGFHKWNEQYGCVL